MDVDQLVGEGHIPQDIQLSNTPVIDRDQIRNPSDGGLWLYTCR